MAQTALERRSHPFYRALNRSGVSGRRRRFHPFLQILFRQCAGKIPSGAFFAGGPPTALGRGVGETGAEEAVRCRCAGAAKGPPPPWPPRFAVSPPGGAWGKLLSPPPSCRPAPVGPLGAFGAAPSRSRRSENRVVAFFSPSPKPLVFPQAPAVRPSWSRAVRSAPPGGGRQRGRFSPLTRRRGRSRMTPYSRKPLIEKSRCGVLPSRELRAVRAQRARRRTEWTHEGGTKGGRPSSARRELHPLPRERT